MNSDRFTKGDANVDPDLLTVKEAASLLSVSERTLWKMIAEGRLAAIRLSRRITRIHRTEVRALIDGASPGAGRA
jgi:excisionase family DNA binding protein